MSDSATEEFFFELEGVYRAFGSRGILQGVDLRIPKGSITVVLGGSGAGKSVLLKHLNGLIRPERGIIRMDGMEIQDREERELLTLRKRIGILFQDGALFDSLTVGENVAFPLAEAGEKSADEIDREVTEVLELVGLPGEKDKMPSHLSGGMRKRASLARAVISRPDCVLCDEPTAGLDPILSETISHLIRKLVTDRNSTAVVVTHDLGAMKIMADHIVFLREGKVCFAGNLEELENSHDEGIQTFLYASGGGG